MPSTNTGVSLPTAQHQLLRSAARGVQKVRGGRCSASALLSRLIEENKASLEAMAQPELSQLAQGGK